jgi:hypothetical protein
VIPEQFVQGVDRERERILAAETRIPDAALPEFGFNSLEK